MNGTARFGSFLGRGVLTAAVLAAAFAAGRWNHRRNDRSATVAVSAPVLPPVMNRSPLLRTNLPPAQNPPTLPDSPDRVASARERHGAVVAARFAAAGVNDPAREVFLRAFKYEGELELWARNRTNAVATGGWRRVHTFPILRASGHLGPKRQEGDGQVPEGFYVVERFNPKSLFHLSMGLNYPNASDLVLTTDREHPGSDIYIHGDCESIGCLAMGDPAIEEIYLAAWDAKLAGQTRLAVQIFPCRMTVENWTQVLAPACVGNEALEKFWRGLQTGYDRLEQRGEVAKFSIGRDGAYIW